MDRDLSWKRATRDRRQAYSDCVIKTDSYECLGVGRLSIPRCKYDWMCHPFLNNSVFTVVTQQIHVKISPLRNYVHFVQFSSILCGVEGEKSIRENAVVCEVRKLMLPLEPQFVRLSLRNEELRKSHTTTCTPHTHTHTYTLTLQIYIIKCTINTTR